MRIIPDQLRSKNLVPFKKRHGRYKIPGMTSENEILMDRVDPDLSPEEQSYVRHYLGYADALIKSAEDKAPLDQEIGDFSETAMSKDEQAREQLPLDRPPADVMNGSGPEDASEKAA